MATKIQTTRLFPIFLSGLLYACGDDINMIDDMVSDATTDDGGDTGEAFEALTGTETITPDTSQTMGGDFQYPYAEMAWQQANEDGFAPSQIAALQGHVYEFVVIPKMHRENIDTSYYESLEHEVTSAWNTNQKVFGYFNAHYHCKRYGIEGHTPSNFSKYKPNGAGDCLRVWNKNNAEAKAYVDAVLTKIDETGAQGLHIDFPWQGSDSLGPLAGYIIKKATEKFGDGNVSININSKLTGDLVAAQAQSTWIPKIEKVGPEFFDKREEEKNHELVNDVIEYLGQIPNVERVELQSKWCEPTFPYDPSTITGNWHYLNYYQANACDNQNIECIYLCTRGNSCEGNTDATLDCGNDDIDRLLGEVLTDTSYWPDDDPYSEIVSLGDTYSVTGIGVRTDWWKKRPNKVSVYNWSNGQQGELIASKDFPDYLPTVCGYDLESDCSVPGHWGSEVGELQVDFAAREISAVKVVAEGLLDPANGYTLIMGARVYGVTIPPP